MTFAPAMQPIASRVLKGRPGWIYSRPTAPNLPSRQPTFPKMGNQVFPSIVRNAANGLGMSPAVAQALRDNARVIGVTLGALILGTFVLFLGARELGKRKPRRRRRNARRMGMPRGAKSSPLRQIAWLAFEMEARPDDIPELSRQMQRVRARALSQGYTHAQIRRATMTGEDLASRPTPIRYNRRRGRTRRRRRR